MIYSAMDIEDRVTVRKEGYFNPTKDILVPAANDLYRLLESGG